ncbi:YcjF family protein [Idiomarina piscisalsi]|uniref:YcjF family protein n=1 Tax=Idiomarina piscisalsi TaxID=1096243 RepID=UPI001381B29E|nr:TIGR01620 family protein [Idiomarina piscisalsi]MTJ01919.1 TIGR01620 family protein [Idiomarina piscisalsi]
MSKHRELTYYSVDEDAEPRANTESVDETGDVLSTVQMQTKFERQPRRWGRWLLLGVVLASVAGIIELVLAIIESWQQSWVLGMLWSAGFTLILGLLVGFFVKEFWQLRQLKRCWHAQSQGTESIEQQLKLLDHPDLEERWMQIYQPYWSDSEKCERFECDILSRVDQQASRLISRWSAEAAAIIAVSPFAVLDMLIILWRNQRMIHRIAGLYGVKLGYLARIRLWRQVLANIAYSGLSEAAVDLGTQWVSAELITKLSVRAGQGLGAGLLTARLGYQVMSLCRPLPFQHTKKPGYGQLQKDLLSQLKGVLPSLYKAHFSKGVKTPESKVEN